MLLLNTKLDKYGCKRITHVPTNSEAFSILESCSWWDLKEIQGSSITQLDYKNSSKSNITGAWLKKTMGWKFKGSMIYVNKVYSCFQQDCTLEQRLLSSVQCIREGKEDISERRTSNPNWDQHVSAPWKFKKSVNDLSTWLLQLGTRIESYFWPTEIRDLSGKSVSRYNSLLGFGCLKKSCLVATSIGTRNDGLHEGNR